MFFVVCLWFLSPLVSLADTGEGSGASVYLDGDSFSVQTKTTVDYIYLVGGEGLSPGDTLRVRDPWFHGMRWTKWGNPQLDPTACTALATGGDEASNSLVTVHTSGGATLGVARVDADGADLTSADIHMDGYTEVWLESGTLLAGDTIILRYGDTAYGDVCGHQMPDRAFKYVEWEAYQRLGDATEFHLVTPVPTFHVVARDEAAHLLVVGPSHVLVGEPFQLKVTPLDTLGNPVEQWTASVVLDETGGGQSHTFSLMDEGHWDPTLTLHELGAHRIQVSGGGLEGTSNPILVVEELPEERLFWGDIHVHHGHTYTTPEGVRVDENHIYARDIVGLDVACESEKGRPTEIDGDRLWEELRDECVAYTDEGRYVALLGWEWVGDFQGSYEQKFHHNVYYDDCDGPLGEYEDMVLLEGDDGLYQWVHDVEATYGSRAVLIPHAPRFTGYDWAHQDDSLRRLVEVYSEWGNNLEPPNAADGVQSALKLGNKLGFIAGSDNHDGWMGNQWSSKAVPSGLAAFWAPDLTRADIWQALHDRRTYGTTGHRSILEFWAQDGATIPSGQVYLAQEPTFHWTYYGQGAVARVSLLGIAIREDASMETLQQEELDGALDVVDHSFTWSTWDGSDYAVWLQVEHQEGGDGDDPSKATEKAWSSPIWLTRDCQAEEGTDPAGRCQQQPDSGAADSGAPPSRSCLGCNGAPTGPGGALALLLFTLFHRRRRP